MLPDITLVESRMGYKALQISPRFAQTAFSEDSSTYIFFSSLMSDTGLGRCTYFENGPSGCARSLTAHVCHSTKIMLQEKNPYLRDRTVFQMVIRTLGTSAANPLQTRGNNVKTKQIAKKERETGVRETNSALSTDFQV